MTKRNWVLKCPRSGYFREWTGIGPRCTQNVADAARFATKREALRHPAYTFSLTSFEPVRVQGSRPRAIPVFVGCVIAGAGATYGWGCTRRSRLRRSSQTESSKKGIDKRDHMVHK